MTCTGGRLASFFAMDSKLSVPRDVYRYPTESDLVLTAINLMSLPKRNRRNAQIDGTHFHWVKGSRGDNGRGVVTVQLATGTGSKLMVDPYGRITDDEVPDAIRFALNVGWRPDESGPPFWIGFADRIPPQSRFVVRDATDPPYWTEFDSETTVTQNGG